MLRYLSADIICSEKRTVFRERSSRKTVSFEEQIMSKDKYPSIFSQPNWGYCVYYPSVLKIGEYPRIFPSFSWGIFAHVTRLDQSRASENIWWIIMRLVSSVVLCWYIYIDCFHCHAIKIINQKLSSAKSYEIVIEVNEIRHLSKFVRFPKLQIFVEMFRRNLQSPVWKRYIGVPPWYTNMAARK